MAAHDIINIPSNEDLIEHDKDWLATLILKLFEQNQTFRELIKERDIYIHENITTKWTWEKVKNHFNKIDDLSLSLSFLGKLLKEKAICTSKECVIFPSLLDIDRKLYVLQQSYDSVFDPKTAKKKFNNNLNKLKRWESFYWKIRLQLLNAYNEIMTIGIPAETKKENFFKIRNFLHDKHIEILENCDDVNIEINPSENIDNVLKADQQMLTHEDFDKYGNDIFKERRKEINDNRQKRNKKEKENLTKKDLIDVLNKTIQRGGNHDRKSR